MTEGRSKTTRRIWKKIAEYQTTGIAGYDGNPLIEALPPIMNEMEWTEKLFKPPRYFDVEMRNLPNHLRYYAIQNASRFFIPLDIHLDLARRISCAIRSGYLERNPIYVNYWKKVDDKIKLLTHGTSEELEDSEIYDDFYDDFDTYSSTAAYGFSLLGISGIGKSQLLKLIFRSMPQVIYHNNYNGRLMTETQLTWMKLDCPFDGSLKALCTNFFKEVDAILGTSYADKYLKNKYISAQAMIPDIATTALNHHLGVLAIDEIQRISYSKSGGKESLLDFFVQLVNEIGIPVILSGTYKALEVLSKSISQMRRGTGQGDVIWDRMKFDAHWNYFVEKMFTYSLTQHHPNKEEIKTLSAVLYEETQGITDLLVKAFAFAQERTIEVKKEKITPAIVRSVVKDKFQLLRPALKAFRENDKEALQKFDDAYPVFLDDLIAQGAIVPEAPSGLARIEGKISDEPEVKILIDQNVEKDFNSKLFNDETEENNSLKKPRTRKRKEALSKKNSPNGKMMNIIHNSDLECEDAYNLLKSSGLIISAETLSSENVEQEEKL